MGYLDLSKQELEKEYGNLVKRFEEIKGMGLNLNMARGKPSKEQLDLSLPMLDTINSKSDFIGEDKMDCRNYGLLNGITVQKAFCGYSRCRCRECYCRRFFKP